MPALSNTEDDISRSASALTSAARVRMAQTAILQTTIDFHDQVTLSSSLMAVAEFLQQHFSCDRVVIGLGKPDQPPCVGARWAHVAAISQQAVVDTDSVDCQLLADSVSECCANACQIQMPCSDISRFKAHMQLLVGKPGKGIVSTPLIYRQLAVGAIVMESSMDQPWSTEQRELVQQIAHVLAPMIMDRQRAERTPVKLIRDAARSTMNWLRKPEKLTSKTVVAGLMMALLLLCVIPVTHRLSTTAELIPLQLRTITSPVDGYIESIDTSVGERVQSGQTLLSLDTRELQLEQQYWGGELERISAELRAVRAADERKQVMILKAELSQAGAQQALMAQRVRRSTISAPHDGLVVSGDLAKQLGAPVKRGQILIELVPAKAYAVNLLVEEYDISLIKEGQTGELTLQANPQERLAFKVNKIHPVAVANKGRNRFRVEAKLDNKPDSLLPGQTGVGKVQVGDATLVHIAFRRFNQWARLTLWEWFG